MIPETPNSEAQTRALPQGTPGPTPRTWPFEAFPSPVGSLDLGTSPGYETEPLTHRLPVHSVVLDPHGPRPHWIEAGALEASLPVLGHFWVGPLLGRGGMGEVYEGWDPQLQRRVALKLIRDASALSLGRFAQEARAQARLTHPNICRVHEAGQEGGLPFLVLQFIEGKTLDHPDREYSPRELAALLVPVAEALHTAHRAGLIHRDIKPSNIMVEVGEDGVPVPWIMDFGIAKDLEGPMLTQTGLAVGTPAFMAPEQAQGQGVDRRSDLWSLGATLFRMLVGEPPHGVGTSMGLVMRLLSEDVKPPSARGVRVPRDLETILMRCLERDPERRYQTAFALAEDLQRFVDGVPILARAITRRERVQRWVRANRLLTASLALATVALVAAGAFASWSTWRVRRQAALLARFGGEAKELEHMLRMAYLLPSHDTRRERNVLQARLERIRREMVVGGSVAKGPGQVALGQGLLAIGDVEGAVKLLRASWEEGTRGAQVALPLGKALAQHYRKAKEQAERITDFDLRKRKLMELGKEFKEPALARLGEGSAHQPELMDLHLGTMALLEERFVEAQTYAIKAFQRDQGLFEGKHLEGQVLLEQAKRCFDKDRPKALASLEQCQEALLLARSIARSDPSIHQNLAEACLLRLKHHLGTDQQDAAYEDVVRRADEALALQPDLPKPWLLKGEAAWEVALWNNRHGKPWREMIGAMIDCKRKATELAPAVAETWFELAEGYRLQGVTLQEYGEDSREFHRLAIATMERGLQLELASAHIHQELAAAYWGLATAERKYGADPSLALRKGLEAASVAVKMAPEASRSHWFLGGLWSTKARELSATGGDPTEAFQAMEVAYTQCTVLTPNSELAFSNLAAGMLGKVRHLMLRRQDCTVALAKALAAADRAVQLNPKFVSGLINRGAVHSLAGRVKLRRKEDPQEDFQRALADYETAMSLAPERDVPVHNAIEMNLKLAESALVHGRSPVDFLQSATKLLKKASAFKVIAPNYHRLLATRQLYGAWEARTRRGAVRPILTQGILAIEQAIKGGYQKDEETLMVRALLLRFVANQDPSRSGDADQAEALVLKLTPHLVQELKDRMARMGLK